MMCANNCGARRQLDYAKYVKNPNESKKSIHINRAPSNHSKVVSFCLRKRLGLIPIWPPGNWMLNTTDKHVVAPAGQLSGETDDVVLTKQESTLLEGKSD